jgi:DeoR/GlpR family transcriptional regulator of sugar metabolism
MTYGQVSVADLAERFNVTQETIRRDLNKLESQHILKKIHGGAVNIQSKFELNFTARSQASQHEKQNIAQKAIELIKPGDTIFLDFGTTTLAFAKELNKINDITVITNSPTISDVIHESEGNSVILIGGQFINNKHECLGSLALATLSEMFADYAIIGIGAVDKEKGFMDQNVDEAAIARKMIQNSNKTIVLADANKFDKQAIVRVAKWPDVDYLVSNIADDEWQSVAKKYPTQLILTHN